MKRSPRSVRRRHTLLAAGMVLFGLFFLGAGSVLFAVALVPAPSISSFSNRQVDQSTKIYDRTGQVLLYDYNRDVRRDVIPLSEVSPNAIQATIAIEDSSFYEHGAIRLSSIFRAAIADALGHGLAQGGSTITQQLVKNTLLTNEKSIIRKIHEIILSIKLEQVYSKNQILQAYLNNIPYGGTLYGIESASQAYFGIPAKDLSLPQAAYLAAMVQAPSFYSPYGAHRAALDARKNLVLSRMHTLGFISDAAYNAAVSAKVTFKASRSSGIIAPHFVFYIINELKQEYGNNALVSGLRVITTLDANLQQHAQAIITAEAPSLLKRDNASNEAMVAIAPSTGQILAMVGSSNFFSTTTDGQFNAALALRQPGSTMKPFIYSLALEKGYTRDTVIFDAPTQFSTACPANAIASDTAPCYSPKNYDNTFRGPMTLETALAQSINIPAIKLLYLVGIQNAINLAKSFGLVSLGDAAQYGLTVVLGGGEVKLLDLTGAYAAFANGGVKNTPTGILEVDNAQGKVLQKYTPSPHRVLPAHIANDINAMLSDNPARVPEYTLHSPLYFPGYDVAVKTGTTDNTRDAWVVGYTPAVAIGTWAGNNNDTPMVKNIAGMILAPTWHKIMAYALSEYPKEYFGQPDPIPSTLPPIFRGQWETSGPNGTTTPHSLLYWTNKDNPRGPQPVNPAQDPQFTHWEYGVQYWYKTHPYLFKNPPLMVPITQVATSTTATSTTATSTTPGS